MANILAVTKDDAEFQIYQPLTALLRARGHRVTIVAEGLSLSKWLALNEPVVGGRGEPSAFDKHLCRSDIDVGQILEHLMPDLVFTGLPDPNNLGEKFGLAANQMGFKLGYVIDVWGAESRSTAVPDFICTLDAFGKKKIEAWSPYQNRMPKIYVTGSPAMDTLVKVKEKGVDFAVLDMFQGREDPTLLLVGQDECTTPVVDGLVQVLSEVGGVIIPRFHPKFVNRDDLFVPWLKSLAKARCEVLWVGPQVKTQELIPEVDYVVSVFSNALIEAAVLGSVPISWVSDIGKQKMKEALGGLTRFPLVEIGCAIEVSSPEEFLERVVLDSLPGECEKVFEECKVHYHGDGKNAERVVAAIEAELL